LLAGVTSAFLAVASAIVPVQAEASILFQTNSGVWVSGGKIIYGVENMPGIIVTPEVRGNAGFLTQRAQAWSSYRRGDSATGFMLVDPAASGAMTATSARQANARSHVERANAYRLEYFRK
jgi:hypothetical protein